jgi:phosphoglycerol transferase MdoB-like AlkP superfamily enzyme
MEPYDFYGQNFNQDFAFQSYGSAFAAFFLLIAFFVILDLVLKAIAVWRSARMNKPVWFVFLFILNTAGLLPLIFLLVTNQEYARLQKNPKQARKKK